MVSRGDPLLLPAPETVAQLSRAGLELPLRLEELRLRGEERAAYAGRDVVGAGSAGRPAGARGALPARVLPGRTAAGPARRRGTRRLADHFRGVSHQSLGSRLPAEGTRVSRAAGRGARRKARRE